MCVCGGGGGEWVVVGGSYPNLLWGRIWIFFGTTAAEDNFDGYQGMF